MTKPKDPVKLLGDDHLRPNPRRKLGPQNGTLVPCKASKHHGHHPDHEQCPECEARWEAMLTDITQPKVTMLDYEDDEEVTAEYGQFVWPWA